MSLYLAAFALVGTFAWLLARRVAVGLLRRAGYDNQRILVVGDGVVAKYLMQQLTANPSSGNRVVGYLAADANAPETGFGRFQRLGDLADLELVIQGDVIDEGVCGAALVGAARDGPGARALPARGRAVPDGAGPGRGTVRAHGIQPDGGDSADHAQRRSHRGVQVLPETGARRSAERRGDRSGRAALAADRAGHQTRQPRSDLLPAHADRSRRQGIHAAQIPVDGAARGPGEGPNVRG